MPTQGKATSPPEPAEAAPTPFCPAYTRAIEIIGRRWTGAIIRALLSGATRFSDLLASIPDLSDRLLSERLKELEAEGIVQRTVTPSTPVRIDYTLTEKGKDLASVVRAVAGWAESWEKDGGRVAGTASAKRL